MDALIIFYEGKKPSEVAVKELVNALECTNWCECVIEAKHFDSDSIGKAVLVKGIEPQKERKGVRTISISDINEEKRTQAAHQLESLLNISFAQAYDMLKDGKITIPTDIDADTITYIICDNGGYITHGPSEYAISQAVYVMNSYSGKLWDLIHIIEQIRNGVHTKEADAVKNAIEILHSKAAYERLIKMDPNIRSIISIM